MKKIIHVILVAGAVAMAPTAAWAANVSSDDGNGTQYVTAHGDQSFRSSGLLRSESGHNVYYRGVVVYNNYPDYTCNRISDNTDSRLSEVRGGTCAQLQSIPPSADAAGWKICRDRFGIPDGCGPQSEEEF